MRLCTGSEDDCSLDNQKDFNASSGTQESLSETFSVSSYYFIVLASDDAQGGMSMKPQPTFTTIQIILRIVLYPPVISPKMRDALWVLVTLTSVHLRSLVLPSVAWILFP